MSGTEVPKPNVASVLRGVETLINKEKEELAVSALNGKILLLYFSASWCPPCKTFTPQLASFYRTLKESRDDFEVVFLSSDNTESEFNEYRLLMPWLSVPFAKRKEKAKLSRKHKVQSIPTLLVIGADGKLISRKGRDEVVADPKGEKFPWKPKTLYEILDTQTLTNKDGAQFSPDSLKSKAFVALYFSAHWCPPCRMFTPQLASIYHKLRLKGEEFEVLFVSADRDDGQYKEYLSEMPWIALPYKDSRIKELNKKYEVDGIPTVIMVKGSDGTVVNPNARSAVAVDAEGADFPWQPRPLPAVTILMPTDNVIEALNNDVCVVLILVAVSARDTPQIEFTKAAEDLNVTLNANREGSKVRFFIADDGDFLERIATVVGVDAKKENGVARVIAFNLQNNRAKDYMATEISAPNVMEFTKKFTEAQDADT